MNDKLIEKLKKMAARNCWCDNDNYVINDWAGGNIDDAYWGGYEDGQACLAKEILKDLEIK